jgi:hypothetical protein
VTVFHDRRSAAYNELTGNSGDYMLVAIPGQQNADIQQRNDMLNKLGFSGGHIPTRPDVKQQYPVDRTTSVVNMR